MLLSVGHTLHGPAMMIVRVQVSSGVSLEVSWKDPVRHVWNSTAIAQLAGRPIVLKFVLQNCKLYSLKFA